ncbi:hypothetical protein ACTFIV_006462 [Dictyostelium citrinum]
MNSHRMVVIVIISDYLTTLQFIYLLKNIWNLIPTPVVQTITSLITNNEYLNSPLQQKTTIFESLTSSLDNLSTSNEFSLNSNNCRSPDYLHLAKYTVTTPLVTTPHYKIQRSSSIRFHQSKQQQQQKHRNQQQQQQQQQQ